MFEDDEWEMILADAKALSSMPPDERRAAELLKQLLGGEYKPRDVDGAQSTHDFDLCFGNGKVFAVEVTTDASAVDRAFSNQIKQIDSLEVPGLTRVWVVDLVTPGVGPDDQQASKKRIKELKANLPALLLKLEQLGRTELTVSRSANCDDAELQEERRGLDVQSCFSRAVSIDESPRVCFGEATYGGATGPSMIINTVKEKLAPEARKVDKLVRAKEAGTPEAHLFVWLTVGDQHKAGRSEAMSFLRHTGLGGLSRVDLQGIDAVWVAVDAGPAHARDCRHDWPILCFDKDGWHDWQLRRSP